MSEPHDRFEALITKLVEGAASAAERAEVETHLASCPECRAALEAERGTRDALIHEAKAFAEGYDAGLLEANLAHELRMGASSTRWVTALGALFGLLTAVLFVRPVASQPEAWTATLPLALACLGSVYWLRRRQFKFEAIARAAERAQAGYRDLERARIRVNVREFRRCGWFGIAVAVALPTLIALWGFITRIRLQDAFPTAVVKVNTSGALVNVAVLSTIAAMGGVYCLWKAHRLEVTMRDGPDAG